MGSNSFFGKIGKYDPIAPYASKVDPVAHQIYQAGKGYHVKGPGTPGPYAGVKPTLADANAGYITAAQRVAQNAANPRPVSWQQGIASPYQG